MNKAKENRRIIHKKFGGKCAYCGNDITIDNFQMDHLIPKASNRPIGRDIYGKYIYANIDA